MGRNRGAWSIFSREFTITLTRVRSHTRKVDEVADIIRLLREIRTAESVEVIQSIKKIKLANFNLSYYNILYGLNLHFFGRED